MKNLHQSHQTFGALALALAEPMDIQDDTLGATERMAIGVQLNDDPLDAGRDNAPCILERLFGFGKLSLLDLLWLRQTDEQGTTF